MQDLVANWVTRNCHLITAQTHALVVHLGKQENHMAGEILTLSTVVDFGECLKDFVEMYQVNRHWIFNKSPILQSINNCPL